jgi:hypothetical protein
LHAQWLAGSEEIFLTDDFVESARAHALGERLIGGDGGGVVVAGWK